MEQTKRPAKKVASDTVKKVAREVGQKPKNKKSHKATAADLKTLLKGSTKQAFHKTGKPMLATLVDKAFDDEGWLYEVKWDGYRAMAFKNKTILELKSRNDKSFHEKFYPIYDALKALKINTVLDGKIVVVDESGSANFGALQNWRSEADGNLIYYVFDILWYEGQDLKELELTQRRAILKAVLAENDQIKISGF